MLPVIYIDRQVFLSVLRFQYNLLFQSFDYVKSTRQGSIQLHSDYENIYFDYPQDNRGFFPVSRNPNHTPGIHLYIQANVHLLNLPGQFLQEVVDVPFEKREGVINLESGKTFYTAYSIEIF